MEEMGLTDPGWIKHFQLDVNIVIKGCWTRQWVDTRSCTEVNNIKKCITKFVECYHAAYQTLLQLVPTSNWWETFLELKDSDNQGLGKEYDEEGVGGGSYLCSWIWLLNPQVPGAADSEVREEGASEEDVNEVLHVKWATSFARLERWSEEVELLQEEMWQVVMFLKWKSMDWLVKKNAHLEELALDIQSGVNVYAQKQAMVYHNLAISFANLWCPALVSHGLQHVWVTEYLTGHGVLLTDTAPSAWA